MGLEDYAAALMGSARQNPRRPAIKNIALIGPTDHAWVQSIKKAYRAGIDVNYPVVILQRTHPPLALAGSHRLTALAQLVAQRQMSVGEAAGHIWWVDGDAMRAADASGEVARALDVLEVNNTKKTVSFREYYDAVTTLEPWLHPDAQKAMSDQ